MIGMSIMSFPLVSFLHNIRFWLAATTVGLSGIYLSLVWRLTGNFSFFTISLLLLGTMLYLLWEKREQLTLESDVFSTFLGLALIASVLIKSMVAPYFGFLFQISPFLSGLGVALIASGLKELKQYSQEFILVLAISIPETLLLQLFDVSMITAKFSAFFLFHIGFDISLQGVNLVLPTGAVEVNPGCSGLESMIWLLRLAALFLVLFPTRRWKQILVPILALTLGFLVNSVRVALMAILVAYSNQDAFKYWHEGDGAQVFSLIGSVLFGACFYFLIRRDELIPSAPIESPKP
jgi:cyanoexosortase A